MIRDYLTYLYNSHNEHGVHSPFVYEFNKKVLNNRLNNDELKRIREYYNYLKRDKTKLVIKDLGSGSHHMVNKERVVSDIFQNTKTNARFGEILYSLIKYFNYKKILELGTGLGTATAFINEALLNSTVAAVTSIEGSEELFYFTQSHFDIFFPENQINYFKGSFDEVLPQLLRGNPTFDLVLIDGNHTYEATLKYFNQLLPFMHEKGMIIFDDINWSEEMKNAWKEIKLNQIVTCSIDLFRWGIVFFRPEIIKENFTIRFNSFLKAHVG